MALWNRRITKIGLALGGGGARGLAHVGVLKILEENHIPIDIICGTSMGAVVGAMYAYDPDASKVEKILRDYYSVHGIKGSWLEFLAREKEKHKSNLFKEMSNYVQKRYMGLAALSKIGLEDEKTLREPLEDLLPDDKIENMKIPFGATAINLSSANDVLIRGGSIIDAVYASSSIQGIFPPLLKNDEYYSDGGPTTNVPVEECFRMDADFVIGVYLPVVLEPVERFHNGLEVILRADTIAVMKLGKLLTRFADVSIVPDVGHIHWSAFNKFDECYEAGRTAALDMIGNIKNTISSYESKNKW
ncbi:MAG: hypothetical protein GF307_14640, partial [candidate division Zixibacteria bacterium]|nr:hypothetical protein [candidate division Zixibacteria bacterium]